MAGGVDQVDEVIAPLHRGRGTRDRDSTLFFEFHVIHRRTISTSTNFFNLVNPSGVVENSFTQGRFPGVDVSRNTDITQFV